MRKYKVGEKITLAICGQDFPIPNGCEGCFFNDMCSNSSNLLAVFPCEYVNAGNIIFKEVNDETK